MESIFFSLFSNILHGKWFHPDIFTNPTQHSLMPHQTILRLQHKMILIRKRQESTLDPPSLQNIESSQPLRNANPIVLRIVNDQLWRGPVREVLGGVPAAPG
jgi:hypothetical protein